MDRKREMTSVDLAAVVSELDEICGAKVDKAYRYEDDLFRFRMRHYDYGRLELFVQVGPDKRVHLIDPIDVPDAPGRPPNFARMLRNQIGGAELTAVEQHEFDRILRLTFERGDERTTIVAELFGDGNLVVLDSSGEIVDAIRTVRLRSRSVVPGAPYEFPDPQVNPFSIDRSRFEARLRESDADLVRTLATQLNLGGTYAEEICARANADGSEEIDDLDDQRLTRLYDVLADLGSRIIDRDFDARVYYRDDRRIDVVPLPLERYTDLEFESFDRFTDALADYFENAPADESDAEDTPDRTAEIERERRVIEQQQAAIEEFAEDAERIRSQAEALYAQYDLVDEILKAIRNAREEGRSWEEIETTFAAAAEDGNERADAVTSIDPEQGTVTIDIGDHSPTLVVTDGVERNANRLYQEAKAVEEKSEGAREALAETRERLAALESAPAETTADTDDEDCADEPVDWTRQSSIPVRQQEHWYERFRWFHTSDGFLVIGGRNADQNEELVRKYLEPGDRFVHASAHGGPVTILKATGPSEPSKEVDFPDQTLFETGQFAISYSSVWKAGQYGGDAYHVSPDQVSKTPESGETLEKGGFVVRGEREFIDGVPVGVAVGLTCEPETRVIGGPPEPIEERAVVSIRLEPGRFAQSDVAKRIYREFREEFSDTTFVRKIASPDLIQEFLPPGQSTIIDGDCRVSEHP